MEDDLNKNNTISLIHNTEITDDEMQRIINSFKDRTFFGKLISVDSSVVSEYKCENDKEIILLNNIIDEDDEEKKLVSYNSIIKNNEIVFTYNDSEVDDEDDYDRVYFDNFSISFSEKSIMFIMKYNKSLHPKYITSVIKKAFSKILCSIANNIVSF